MTWFWGGVRPNYMQRFPVNVTPGLIIHCHRCGLVVPADAPRPAFSDCDFVALHKLAYYNAKETPAAQHVMAVAAWGLIHHAALTAGEPTCTAYQQAFRKSRKDHFAESAVRKAMTPEQVEAGLQNRRDGALYT